jgi:hypothetical protein
LKSLATDDSIVILPADKGRSTVILDSEDYEGKIRDLLSDERTYEKLKKDPTTSVKNKLINLLKSWKQQNSIHHCLYQKLYPTSECPPKLYGLPKIHKTNAPLRPIVSSCGSVTYNASKYLAGVLGPLVGDTPHHVINSEDLVNKLHDVKLEPDDKLVSYDVCALFTSVPVDQALEVIKTKLAKDKHVSDISAHQIIQLLDLCLSSTYFVYKGEFYKQKHGCAMGSPVSPIVANLYMEAFEEKALSSTPSPTPFWYRYVDDTLTSKKEQEIEAFTAHLNSIDPNIQFTCEVEKDGQIPFLDTLLHRGEDGGIETSVYRKPTHTDQYLNFQSNHPLQHKRSVVHTLFHRAKVLSSSSSRERTERNHVKTALRNNGYPSWVFAAPKPKKPRPRSSDDIVTGFPYVRGLSEKLSRTFGKHGVKVYHKPTNSLRSRLTHVKDPTEKNKVCGAIYHIQCSDCKEDYIGETERPLHKRLREHQTRTQSAVYEHIEGSNHTLDLQSTSVLDTELNPFKRKIKEALHIKARRPSLNRDSGVELPSVYDLILNT